MKLHTFDPVSFLFGVLFTVIGATYLVGAPGDLGFGRQWLVPALLLIAGLAVLASTRTTVPDDRDVAEPEISALDDMASRD